MRLTIVKSRIERSRWLALLSGVTCAALATLALAAPSASASTASSTTHTFQVTYDGKVSLAYHAEGANGDTGCFLSVDGNDSWTFDQTWTITVGFQRTGPGKYTAKIKTMRHVDGPNGGAGEDDSSGLGGDQTSVQDETCQDLSFNPDTGSFACTSKKLQLFTLPNPQMKVVHSKTSLQVEAETFADGFWKYAGKDMIPSDKAIGGCGTYDDTDSTPFASIFAESDSTTKIGIPVKELATLAKGKEITAPVHFGKNTLHPRQTSCVTTLGSPGDTCKIKSDSLDGKFKLTRIK
jgi:hypothetical protein